MPGLGRRTFNAGEVLTAANVQNYLQDQAVMNFAGTATRSSAIPSPSDGMVTYNQTNDQIEAYNGSDWIGVGGLQLVKKQTILSAVTSINVTNAFSAIYENYRILVAGGTSTGNGDMRYSLDGIATGYYTAMAYVNFSTAALAGINQTAATFFNWAGTSTASGSFYMDFDIKNPFTAKAKLGRGTFMQQSISGVAGESHMFNASTASATGFTITTSAGTLTGGTVYVYGYSA